MSIRCGFFTLPRHDPTMVANIIARFQPSCVKYWVSSTSAAQVQAWRDSSPNTIFVMVDGNIGDSDEKNHLLQLDMVAIGKAQADSYARWRDKGFIGTAMSYNEPPIWNGHDYRQKFTEYTFNLLGEAHAKGLNCCIFNFSVGWPWTVLDGDNWWPTFRPAVDTMNAGDYIGLHEYWPKDGPLPLSAYPWLTGRHRLCPYQKPILISECGCDQATVESGSNRGWRFFMSPEQYVEQLRQYHSALDPRVKGTAIFLLDYENPVWDSFDLRYLEGAGVLTTNGWVRPNPYAVPVKIGLPLGQPITATQDFGPSSISYLPLKGHPGIDFSAVVGRSVLAVANGKVTKVAKLTDSYGYHVYINHGWGQSLYAHLSEIKVVEQQDVTAGSTIALSGNTGRSLAPHLHFGLRIYGRFDAGYNDWVDPAPYLGLGVAPVPIELEQIIGDALQRVVLPLNAAAAFEKAGAAKGYLPASPELDMLVGGTTYRAQVYRHPSRRNEQQIVYAKVGDWANLRWFIRPN